MVAYLFSKRYNIDTYLQTPGKYYRPTKFTHKLKTNLGTAELMDLRKANR